MADNKKLVTKEYIDAIETEIQNSKVGQKTPNGGEIFSTYDGENANKALSTASSAFGHGTVAGGKGFKITAISKIDDNTGTYTLNSVTGLEVGMEYNVRLYTAKYKCGKITVINVVDKSITVDGYPDIELSTKADSTYDIQNYLTIVGRPDLGDIDVGFFGAAFGENSIVQDRSGFAAGRENIVLGQYGSALGRHNTVGYASHAEGRDTQAIGNYSHSENLSTQAKGYASHAEGNTTIASGINSHAEGADNEASGNNAHSEGSNTLASGDTSHAEGISTIASGQYSHAEGNGTQATGYASHASGWGTIASATGQTAIGHYNNNNKLNLFEIGNGSDDQNRSNAFSVNADGWAELVMQGNTDKSVVIKEYVDNKLDTIKQEAINTSKTYTDSLVGDINTILATLVEVTA